MWHANLSGSTFPQSYMKINNNLRIVPTSYKWSIFDLWPLSMTLTFDIESWVLYTCEVTARTRYKLHNFDLWPLSVTLTFDIESWVLYATRLLMMLNISTKYHEDTTITCEVTARTRSDTRTHARTYARTRKKKKIVATMSRSLQAGSTKRVITQKQWKWSHPNLNLICVWR